VDDVQGKIAQERQPISKNATNRTHCRCCFCVCRVIGMSICKNFIADSPVIDNAWSTKGRTAQSDVHRDASKASNTC